ncbi:HD-GYP domain-containing protein [Adhaeretor mobilis]|nr:HD-GYP domain-containing protein [Adhaeretor mobilis]
MNLSSPPETTNSKDSPAIVALHELQSATGVAWNLWTRIAASKWVESNSSDDCELDEAHSARMAFHPTCFDLFEKAFGEQSIQSEQSDPNQWWVVSPLLGPYGNLHSVAITTVSGDQRESITKLASLSLNYQREKLRAEQLESENAQFAQQVGDDFEEMTFLRTMADSLAVGDTSLGIKEVVTRSFEMLHGILGAEILCFVELDEAGQPKSSIRQTDDTEHAQVSQDACDVLAQRFCSQVTSGPLVRNDLIHQTEEEAQGTSQQLLIVPVQTSVRQFGWFMAINRGPGFTQHGKAPLLCASLHEFGTWEASLLSTAASVIASHASNLEHLREKGQLLVSVVRSLVSAVEAKDAYTCGHSERVALYTKRLAQHLSYDEESTERIYLTGLLHDVGKIGVSDATLNKAGSLTREEFGEIQEHPDYGWSILCELRQLAYVLPGVLHHHERFDGAGYPDGLSGHDIPLDARIMAVADAYDAMTSDRAYRAGMPHEKAVGILTDGAGTQWDPEIVSSFLEIVNDFVKIRQQYQPHQRRVRTGSAIVYQD